jgi:cell division protein FtsB
MSATNGVPSKKNSSFWQKAMAGGAVFLFVVLLITSLFGKKGLMEIQRTRKSYEGLLLEMKTLQAQKVRLEKEIAQLERNPQAVEKEAREKLWLMKKDEIVIVDKKK